MSSYNINNYSLVFEYLCKSFSPSAVVEFGILNGYSLDCFVNNVPSDTPIFAFDIFDSFVGNHPAQGLLVSQYAAFPNVSIIDLNFFDSLPFLKTLKQKRILFHIDIANNADVYKFAVESILPVFPASLVLLEGGSPERDQVDWMLKYDKPPINPYLETIKHTCSSHKIFSLDPYPSLTVISPHNYS